MNGNEYWKHLPRVSIDTHNSTLEEFQSRRKIRGEMVRFCDELLASLAVENPNIARLLRTIREYSELKGELAFRLALRLVFMIERQFSADELEAMFKKESINPRDP